MKEHHIKLLECPVNFSDLKPIENMWSICKQRLRLHHVGKADSGSNSSVVQGPPNLKRSSNSVDSMPKRMKMLLNNRGGHIMYSYVN